MHVSPNRKYLLWPLYIELHCSQSLSLQHLAVACQDEQMGCLDGIEGIFMATPADV